MEKKLNDLTAVFLFALFCTFIPSGTFSQVNEIYTILYTQFSPISWHSVLPQSVKLDAFGNAYVIGHQQQLDSVLVIKYNSAGAKLWQKAFKSKGGPQTAELDALGNIHILFNYTPDQIKIVKINPSGTILWTAHYLGAESYNDHNPQKIRMKIGTDGIYAALYTTTTPDANFVILKFSHYGNLNWQKFYNTSGRTEIVHDIITGITIDNNDNVYVTGSNYNTEENTSSFTTLKYTSGGTFLWMAKYSTYAYTIESIAVDNTENVYIGGITISPFGGNLLTVIKYGPSGNLEWVKKHSGNKPNSIHNYAKILKIDPNGDLIAGGNLSDTDGTKMAVIKYSPSGTQLWLTRHSLYLADFSVTNTGDILAVGPINTGINNFTVIKYSSSGILNWTQTYNSYAEYFFPNGIDSRTDASGNLIFYVTSQSYASSDNDMITVKYEESVLPRTPVSTNNETPAKYELKQNYPNPFNPQTKISFSIKKAGNVKLAVYDALGKEISVLTNGEMEAGTYEIDFEASHLASGVYFYKLESESFTDIKKMMLIK